MIQDNEWKPDDEKYFELEIGDYEQLPDEERIFA
jgi:hypothetical protein